MECVLCSVCYIFSVKNRGVKEIVKRYFQTLTDFIYDTKLHAGKFAV